MSGTYKDKFRISAKSGSTFASVNRKNWKMLYSISDSTYWLIVIDEKLMLILNGLHTKFLDGIMWTVSDRWVWIPLYLLLAGFILRHYSWRRGMLCLLLIILTVTVADQICASVLRPAVARLRPACPDNPISAVIHTVNGFRSGRYGFPSCHAANSFALAVFVSLCFRRRFVAVSMVLWSVLVAYSRIYLGLHYPGDILAGMLVGGIIAVLFHRVFVNAAGLKLS